jgi:flagella basal body P-ring formation protein FlgA
MLCLPINTDSRTGRHRDTAWWRAGCALGVVWGLTFASSMVKAQEAVLQQAKVWVGQTQNVPLEQLVVAPLDSRLKVETCEREVRFDYPFLNRQSVRARCDAPSWQLFLQVTTRGVASASPTPPNTTTPGLVMRTVWVSPHMLKRGTVIQPGLLQQATQALPAGDTQLVADPREVHNMELLRDWPANTPLRSYDVKPTQLVKRGQQVLVSVGEGRGFQITVRAEAQQDGLMGEQIRLKNLESGRMLSAVVSGPSTAKGI